MCRCLRYARGLCLCPCVTTPRGFTALPTQDVEYSCSGFIPTNKQTNKQINIDDEIHHCALRIPRRGSPLKAYGRITFLKNCPLGSTYLWNNVSRRRRSAAMGRLTPSVTKTNVQSARIAGFRGNPIPLPSSGGSHKSIKFKCNNFGNKCRSIISYNWQNATAPSNHVLAEQVCRGRVGMQCRV